jgi:MinD-like ATPase involved in chromosome partitioning or flagellar assembly
MSKTIVFFSAKGGVGKTLIATNLAVSLALDQKKKVCLVDMDLQVVGDIAKMLNIAPQKSMVDFIYLLDKQKEGVRKEDFIVSVKSLGIDFFPAILKPQQAPYLDPAKIKDVFNLISNSYDYIIVDAGDNFCEVFISAIDQSNLLFLILTPDILSIYQTRWAINMLQLLHLPNSLIKLVINRAESASSISWQEIKVSLPADIIAQIPSEGRAVGEAVNRGIPIVIDNPRAKFSQTIQKFASQLLADEAIFVQHVEIDKLKIKEVSLDQSKKFWQVKGLSESPATYLDIDEADTMVMLKRKIHSKLIEELDLKRLDSKVFSDSKKAKDLRDKAEMAVTNLLVEETGSIISSPEIRRRLVKEILDEALGLGP